MAEDEGLGEAGSVDGVGGVGGDAGEVVTMGVGQEMVPLPPGGHRPRIHRERQPPRHLYWHRFFRCLPSPSTESSLCLPYSLLFYRLSPSLQEKEEGSFLSRFENFQFASFPSLPESAFISSYSGVISISRASARICTLD